jgi:aryl carrier-like protein
MIDLATEKDTLVKADRDIAEGEERITRQVALIAQLREEGYSVSQAEMLLATFRHTLQAWQEHRVAIIHAIDRLERQAG